MTDTLIDAIGFVIDEALIQTHVSMPGKVLSYDSSEQRATVQPIVRVGVVGEDDERTSEKLPPIEGVPVIFPGAGSIKIIWPINAGDIVNLVFSECSIDKWLNSGASDLDPDDDRRNDLSDAVAIPGLLPFKNASDHAHATDLVLAAPGIRLGSNTAFESTILGDSFKALLTTWQAALDTYIVIPVPSAPQTATYAAASAAFISGLAAVLSLKVKVE